MKITPTDKQLIVICLLLALSGILISCSSKKERNALKKIAEPIPVEDTTYWKNINTQSIEAIAKEDNKSADFFQQQIIEYCKKKGLNARLFHAYFINAQRMYRLNNTAEGEKYADSAGQIANQSDIRALKPQLNILLAQNPKLRGKDSALMYYKAALEDSAYLEDNYKDALFSGLCVNYLEKEYYREAKSYIPRIFELAKLDPNRNHRLAGYLALYQWQYLCDMELNDTISAFNAINTAYKIMTDSLNGNGDDGIYLSLADYYFVNKKNYDSALYFYDQYAKATMSSDNVSGNTIPQILKAEVYVEKNDYKTARAYLAAIKQNGLPPDDAMGNFLLDYYETYYKVNKHYGNFPAALSDLEKAFSITKKKHEEEKSKVLAELEESLTKARAEKTILEKEQQINKQKLYILAFAGACILFILIGLLLFINQRRKKLLEQQRLKTLEQQIIIEKTQLRIQAEDDERKRISKEIHDDIGPALTTLNLAANMLQQTSQDEHRNIVSLITKNTSSLSIQMNEIIWSLNSGNDNVQSLVAFIRKFATSFLQPAGIKLIFNANIDNANTLIEGYKRRNVYHSVKEVLNNAVKYAQAAEVKINITHKPHQLYISIHDNGIGLPAEEKIHYGNGFKNIKKNIAAINGTVHWQNTNGLAVEMSIPLNATI